MVNREGLLALRRRVEAVTAKEELVGYVYDIVRATRESGAFDMGASPRAGIQLLKAARAVAVVRGRDYATPDDVRHMAPSVLGHRLVPKGVAQLVGSRLQALSSIIELLDSIQVP